jgi:hypothetical protein
MSQSKRLTGSEAIAQAQKWVKGLGGVGPDEDFFIFEIIEALLTHIEVQGKDVEGLTHACQILLRENKRLSDVLDRG